jgi:hypothetical protein
MSERMVRTHVLLPASLLEKVDRRAGQRKRSEYIAAAVEQELHRQELLEAFGAFAGSMDDVEVPGWETHDSAVEWVREQRPPTARDHWDGEGEGGR